MEFPHLGKHCSVKSCNQLDFLPVKCDACLDLFCCDHMSYLSHNCASAAQKDVQVPVCPLCNKPVALPRGTSPDYAVGKHLDNDCRSDSAEKKRQIFVNDCNARGCKIKEMIPVKCYQCALNFCLKHRHPDDHNCEKPKAGPADPRAKAAEAAAARMNASQINELNRVEVPQNVNIASIQGNLREDEALARALQLSMEEEQKNQRKGSNRNKQSSCSLS